MLQVKIFEGPDAKEIEIEINQWLRENMEIDVIQIAQSESAVADDDGDLCGNTTLSVFYRRHE